MDNIQEQQFEVQFEAIKTMVKANAATKEEGERRAKMLDESKYNTKAYINLLDMFGIPYPGNLQK